MNKKIISIGFALLLFSVSIINLIIPQRSFSENENRYLQMLPALNFEDIISGKYSENFASYSSDQFFSRDEWISLKTVAELALMKKDNGRIYFGSNNTLFDATEKIDNKQLDKNTNVISEYVHTLKSTLPDLNATVLLIPTSTEILSDLLPAYAPVPDQHAAIRKVSKQLNGKVTVYDPTDLLKANKNNYLYFRTDHHWTSAAAYFVYREWAKQTGLTPFSQDDTTVEQVSSSFYGTLYSKANLFTIKPDLVMAYRPLKATPVWANYGQDHITQTLYFGEFLDKKDKYSYFLGGNKPAVEIKTGTKWIFNEHQSFEKSSAILASESPKYFCI